MNKKGLELMEAAYAIKSIHVDKVHCICKGPNARITFMEEVPELDNAIPRVSITMAINDFFETVQMLGGVVKQIQEQNKTKEETSQPQEPEQPNPETKH